MKLLPLSEGHTCMFVLPKAASSEYQSNIDVFLKDLKKSDKIAKVTPDNQESAPPSIPCTKI